MNKIQIIILLFSFQFSNATTIRDSLNLKTLEYKVSTLENNIKTVENNQLNYKIEKDLLKETYSNNYENINMIITIILGIIGVLGYLGIRDINSIKKEYLNELSNFRTLKAEFELKYNEFNTDKNKIDSEIKDILLENEKQNRKIKFIELKEKIVNFISQSKLYEALDFIGAALEINPNDNSILTYKARVLCRLNQLDDSIAIYKKLRDDQPNDTITGLNLLEMTVFGNDIKEYESLMTKYSQTINSKSEGKVSQLFDLIREYHSDKNANLIEPIKKLIDFNDLNSTKRIVSDWDLSECKYVLSHLDNSLQKTQLQNIAWYLDGQINGKILCERLSIKVE